MLANLLRPWLLVRLSLSLAATIACVIGLLAAREWIRAEAFPLGHPARIRAERRAELVSALVQTAMVASAFAALAGIVGADRAHGEIRGAMCAYGVLASAPHGFVSLATGLLASAACAAWLGLHRLDLRLPTPELTRPKLIALIAILPAVAFDLVTATRFALELDFGVVATCCSSGLGEVSTVRFGDATAIPSFPIAIAAGVLALAASIALARRPGRLRAISVVVAVLVFALSGVAAATDVVAPHAYGVPTHRCAFCLLGPLAHGLGYPLLSGLFVAVCLGAALVAIESERAAGAASADALERKLARASALASATALVCILAPVLVHRLTTGAFVVSPWG